MLIGIAGFFWTLTEQKKEKQRLQEHRQILNAQSAKKIDNLISGDIDYASFADNIQSLPEVVIDEDSKHKLIRPNEIRELIFYASVLCMAAGGIFIVGWLLLWSARGVIYTLSVLRILFRNIYLRRRDTKPTETHSDENEKIAVLYSSQTPVETQEVFDAGYDDISLNTKPFDLLAQNLHKSIIPDYHENAENSEDSLRAQAENIEKQTTKIAEATAVVKDASENHSKPLNTSLEELTQQVSAISEYASQQQSRIQKLQDGYDWNIIRTFCLKIIRCIGNLENRIKLLSDKNIDTTDLEQARDELIFALESSGVEQFEPEIHTQYRGQEKTAEVVKEKQPTKDLDMKGKIAEVIKPGYRYVIDDENVKVVCAARVKLFGDNQIKQGV